MFGVKIREKNGLRRKISSIYNKIASNTQKIPATMNQTPPTLVRHKSISTPRSSSVHSTNYTSK